MPVRKTIVALIPITLLSLQPAMATSEVGMSQAHRSSSAQVDAGLRPVSEQARDMGYSDKMLNELSRIFPTEKGVRINEDVPFEESVIVPRPTKRTVRVIKSRQVATAVTDDGEISGGPHRARVPSITAVSKEGGLEESRPAQLFTEESRDLEERISKDTSTKLKAAGYDVQAVNVKMESLTATKIIVLATTAGLTEANAKEKLLAVRTVLERDVLSAYPNMKLTKGSSFGIASAVGGQITETSAMAFELDKADFQPALRQKNVAVATPKPVESAVTATRTDEPDASAKAAKGEKSSKRRRRVAKAAESTREPTAVSLQDKEKAEQARRAAPAQATPPKASTEVKEKARQETITPSESDFQD